MAVQLNPVADLITWLRGYADRRARLAELDGCCDQDLQRIAADVGVSQPAFGVLAGKSRDAADLLYRRMAILHLDADLLGLAEPGVLRDLQRNCSLCDSRGRCVSDLAKGAGDSGWEEYCPNTVTLLALVAARPEPSDLDGMIEYLNTVGAAPPERGAK
jgi:hypothetical protein